jgi:hypothetical protein
MDSGIGLSAHSVWASCCTGSHETDIRILTSQSTEKAFSLEDTSWQKAQVNELHDFTCSHQSCVICSLGSMKCILKGEKAQHVCVHGPHNADDCHQDAGACVVAAGTNPCRMCPLQCTDL